MSASAPGFPATRVLALVLAAGVLAACAAPRPAPPPVVTPVEPPPAVELTPLEGARVQLIEAEAVPEPVTVRRAIDAVLALDSPDGGLLLRAERLWGLLPEAGTSQLADRYRGARLAVMQGLPATALERLPPVDDRRNNALYVDALALFAELLTDAGTWAKALQVRIELDPELVSEPELQIGNQRVIWDLLATLGSTGIEALRRQDESQLERGWFELFSALRDAETDPGAIQQALGDWVARHPAHPAQLRVPDLRDGVLAPSGVPVRSIAVLLPLSGPLADLGNAVLEGIRAWHQEDTGSASRLLVFDTEGRPSVAAARFDDAVRQGVDRVIGPLTREEAERLAATGSGPPTLLLNRPGLPLPEAFTVLSLSPEDDARAAAELALASEWHSALVLVTEGNFGDRVAGAFRNTFESHGGNVADERRYQARSAELNTEIGSVLQVDLSEARIARVARQLGLSLQGDPQVRADIDLIFIAGPARDLRMVLPHLHYHRAHRLPMLATSHAYEGHPQPVLDGDLGGLRFPDVPWLYPELNPEPILKERLLVRDDTSGPAERLQRFTALGIDAARIATALDLYWRSPHLELQGVAGTWSWQPLPRTWRRDPAWLQFRSGVPQPAQGEIVLPLEEDASGFAPPEESVE